MSPLDNEIRPDKQFHTTPRDPEFFNKLAAAKKEPLDHIVTVDKHAAEVTVYSFADTFKARDYQKGLPRTLVTFEDQGDPEAAEPQVQNFVHRVESGLKAYDPEPHLQAVLLQIQKLRQELNDLGNMNLRRFLLDRLDEVENEARRVTQPDVAADFERKVIPLRQALWALDTLGRAMQLHDVLGINSLYMVQPEPQWPAGQPVPTWSRDFGPALDSIRSQPVLPNQNQMAVDIRETVHRMRFIVDHLAQN